MTNLDLSLFYVELENSKLKFESPLLSDQDKVGLKVLAEVSAAEPDVGIFGNGKISLAIEEIYCSEDGFDEEENIIDRFDEERIEDIAHQIYNQVT